MTHVIKGTLCLDQMATHVPHLFEVPEGTRTLRVAFDSSPKHPGVGVFPHLFSISVYGPNGGRGTRHNNKDQSPVISTGWASPGYLAGPIEAGQWSVEIDVHRILPPGNVSYTISVTCDPEETAAPEETSRPVPAPAKRRGSGWYTGDLHGHTFHSDGIYSPAEYLEVARGRGYDFVSLTDHNTCSAVPELRALAGDSMTVFGGTELTTFNGHAVVLGRDTWTDWRIKEGQTMSARAQELLDSGALYIIAHPKSEGHPICTGCRWAYSDMLPGPARHVEIWNNAWIGRGNNEEAVKLYYRWLNEGRRLVATAGTDTHRPMPPEMRLAANRVFAEDNTAEHILAALRLGHSYVTGGPDMHLRVTGVDGVTAGMGDLIAPGHLQIELGWNAGHGGYDLDTLYGYLIRNGEEAGCWPCKDESETRVQVDGETGDWFTLELRDERGELHGLTNPVFVGASAGDWT